MDFEERLRALDTSLAREEGRRDAVIASIAREEQNQKKYADRVDLSTKAIEVLQAASETRRQELKDRVETLVTRGLRAVFNRSDLEFYFKIDHRRDVMSVTPALRSMCRGKILETNIVEGHGGGVADVISFILRVIVLTLSRPKLAPLLILDEPFRHVSLEYLKGCASLMKELSKTAGVQFIIVTHKPELLDAADITYRTTMKDGVTSFEQEHLLNDGVFHAPQSREQAPAADPFVEEEIAARPNDFTVKLSDTVDALALDQRQPASKKRSGRAIVSTAKIFRGAKEDHRRTIGSLRSSSKTAIKKEVL